MLQRCDLLIPPALWLVTPPDATAEEMSQLTAGGALDQSDAIAGGAIADDEGDEGDEAIGIGDGNCGSRCGSQVARCTQHLLLEDARGQLMILARALARAHAHAHGAVHTGTHMHAPSPGICALFCAPATRRTHDCPMGWRYDCCGRLHSSGRQLRKLRSCSRCSDMRVARRPRHMQYDAISVETGHDHAGTFTRAQANHVTMRARTRDAWSGRSGGC